MQYLVLILSVVAIIAVIYVPAYSAAKRRKSIKTKKEKYIAAIKSGDTAEALTLGGEIHSLEIESDLLSMMNRL